MKETKPADRSEIRQHYYLDQYVVISPSRRHSLHHPPFVPAGSWTDNNPTNEAGIYEIKDAAGRWLIKVIRNLFSAFTPDNPNALGYHEVVLDANPLITPFSKLKINQVELILNTYCQRISELKQRPHIKYVSVYHNTGVAAGASVQATHSQVAAIAVVPPDLAAKAHAFAHAKKRAGCSPIAAALRWEEEQQQRIITRNRWAVALAPFASQFPYEAWLIPRRSVHSICDLHKSEMASLAKMLHAITACLEADQISYNFMLEENIKGMDNHFMIRITPRPNTWAGFELNTGIAINPVAPEVAATWYRTQIKSHYAI